MVDLTKGVSPADAAVSEAAAALQQYQDQRQELEQKMLSVQRYLHAANQKQQAEARLREEEQEAAMKAAAELKLQEDSAELQRAV